MPNAKFFIDPTRADAGSYYNLFPVEPTKSASSSDWLRPDGKLTFLPSEQLDQCLTAIAGGASSGGNILLIGHGTDRGLKLFIGDEKNNVQLELQTADAIRLNQEGKQSDDDTAQILKMKPDAYRKLKGQIEKVQALGLNRVDARACLIGKDPDTMSAMQQFFNCNIFCAPKRLDYFGGIVYGSFVSASAFDKWVQAHRAAEVSGSPGDRFGFDPNLSDSGGPKPKAAAESAKGAKDWADSKMPAGGKFTGQNQLFFHAFIMLALNKLVFAGEPAFRAELVEAAKGHVPSRKIDIKNATLPP